MLRRARPAPLLAAFVVLLPLAAGCATDADHDGASPPADCDDTDPTVFPAARERCNGHDDDCDGQSDEDGASGGTTWYRDADGDGQAPADADLRTACAPPPGFGARATGDCDDAAPTTFTGAAEQQNGHDDDCDGRTDETPIDEGLVYVDEIARQPRLGRDSVVVGGQWFEVANAGWLPMDLAGVWVVRSSAEVGTDQFQVDPAAALVVPPGGYATLCKSDLRTDAGAAGNTLYCDYTWGDPGEPETWAGPFHDNTFNLQRDTDSIALYLPGTSGKGRLIDRVAWTFDAASTGASTGAAWPREAAHSMSFAPPAGARPDDPAAANDIASAWCTAPDDGLRWWSGVTTSPGPNGQPAAAAELGSPGAANPACKASKPASAAR